jgi:hypothetical protein
MVVHTNDSYNWSNLTVCTAEMPATCDALNTLATRDADQVVWLLAAFEAASTPAVTVVYFGIDYDDAHLDPGVNFRFCGPAGSLEVPDDDWPYSGRGNSVAFGSPDYRRLFPFYAFRISGGVDGAFFCTSANPTGGYAAFVDDGNPPGLDACTRFGCIRWGQVGFNDCPGPIVSGACCFEDGTCDVMIAQACMDAGGAYQGDDTNCNPNPCPQPPTGACCVPGGFCLILQEQTCAEVGGVFQGDGVDCDPNPCPQPPTGACCHPDGSCDVQEEASCVGGGGAYQGDDVPCDPDPCPVLSGACCFEDGHCEILTVPDCARYVGQFMGAGAPCDPNPCTQPSEACCFASGYCTFVPRDNCIASGGNPQGPGTNCDMIACRPPQLGACCLDTGECVVNLQEECAALGGTYLEGTPCEPTPCDDTAVEPTTWGRVRASFR